MGSGAASHQGEHDALSELISKKGDCVIGSKAGDTKMIIEGPVASYALKQNIGDGGYGVVWKAIVLEVNSTRQQNGNLKVGGMVAVKIINDVDPGDESLVQAEIENMQVCMHPNILQCYDSCVDVHGSPCIITEFVSGLTLEDHLAEFDDGVPEDEACRLFLQMLDAVRCMHNSGIIHCDLKPLNVMLDHAGNVKIIDFGSSCRKELGKLPREKARGSPVYSAPEQIDLAEFDEAADLWSLGIILHEMLTGMLPENAYNSVRSGCELLEPRSRQFRNVAWTLIKGLVTCRSNRIPMEGRSRSIDVKSVRELAEEWSQDFEYGDDTFCEEEEVMAENETAEGYDSGDFDSCSSDEDRS